MRLRLVDICYLIIILTTACSSGQQSHNWHKTSNHELADSSVEAIETRIAVTAMQAAKTEFPIEIRTNGVLKVNRMIDIKFKTDGRIEHFILQEGQHVRKGDTICKQDDTMIELQIDQEHVALLEAEVKLNELIILAGGEVHDTTSVSKQHLETFRVTSGWYASKARLAILYFNLSQCTLIAPFTGVVSRVQIKEHEEVQTGMTAFTLIDPETLEVEFFVLEKDLTNIDIGQPIKVNPLAPGIQTILAKIDRIDPQVNENGLILVRGTISHNGQDVITGMKCMVTLQHILEDQLVVPKEAVVVRSNMEVIFVADTVSNLAKWKYVSIGHQNEQLITVVDGLESSDLVIIEGNLNLAHDAEIQIELLKTTNTGLND